MTEYEITSVDAFEKGVRVSVKETSGQTMQYNFGTDMLELINDIPKWKTYLDQLYLEKDDEQKAAIDAAEASQKFLGVHKPEIKKEKEYIAPEELPPNPDLPAEIKLP